MAETRLQDSAQARPPAPAPAFIPPDGGGPVLSGTLPEDATELPATIVYPSRRWSRVIEKGIEKAIFLASASAVAVIFLIFLFVARESIAVLLQQTTTVVAPHIIQPSQAASVPKPELAKYLGMSVDDLKALDADTISYLVQTKAQEKEAAAKEPDLKVNAVSYRMMFLPYKWRGYDKPSFVWQPESKVPKFNIVPLILGTVKCTIIALLFAVPLSLLAAIYVSQLAPNWVRQIVKPSIELLAGIPSVVLGFFALMVMASWLQSTFDYPSRLNALVAGLALGLAVIPIVFTISEDALRAVPKSYKEASTALGASNFETTARVVVPAAMPGIFAAVVLGLGRAVGETMIVLMASGNAWIMGWSPTVSARTITASIAAELAETVRGGHHYQVLFFLGTLLFTITFVTNFFGSHIITRMRRRMMGGRG